MSTPKNEGYNQTEKHSNFFFNQAMENQIYLVWTKCKCYTAKIQKCFQKMTKWKKGWVKNAAKLNFCKYIELSAA